MKFYLVTLFEEACEAYLTASIIGRARREKKISIAYQNPRDFANITAAENKHAYNKVDERPYGGGPGMVMQAMPVVKAVEKAVEDIRKIRGNTDGKKVVKKKIVIWFSPHAKQFTNKDADTIKKRYDTVVLVCGRYEGIDERAKKIIKTLPGVLLKEFAVGEAIYTGGEIPSLAIIDAITRRLPDVLGNESSVEERRISSRVMYTRPETIIFKDKKYRVPRVLQTGHHANIDAWRKGK